MNIVDLAEDLQTRTVDSNKSALKHKLQELNVRDEGHVQGLATADSSSVVLRDKKGIHAKLVHKVRPTLFLSIG